MQKKITGVTLCAVLVALSFFTVLLFPPCSLLLAPCSSAQAQQRLKKLPRIGILRPDSSSSKDRSEGLVAFLSGLRDLGSVEGQNILFEYRWAEGKYERLPDLAAELARLNVDVIFTTATPA